MKELTQYKLTRRLYEGTVWQIVFLDAKLDIGDQVTLKGESGVWWLVEEVYQTAKLKELDKQRGWQNDDYTKHKGNILN